jgi:toxin ParE1/3/4
MRVIFHPESLQELTKAGKYYQKRAGLGLDFLASVDAAITALSRDPLFNRIHQFGARRELVKRFPYSVFYRVFPDHIQILSIAHHSRRPGYWRSRGAEE